MVILQDHRYFLDVQSVSSILLDGEPVADLLDGTDVPDVRVCDKRYDVLYDLDAHFGKFVLDDISPEISVRNFDRCHISRDKPGRHFWNQFPMFVGRQVCSSEQSRLPSRNQMVENGLELTHDPGH